MGRQRALHTENRGLAAATLRRHISTFRGYQILFSIQVMGTGQTTPGQKAPHNEIIIQSYYIFLY